MSPRAYILPPQPPMTDELRLIAWLATADEPDADDLYAMLTDTEQRWAYDPTARVRRALPRLRVNR